MNRDIKIRRTLEEGFVAYLEGGTEEDQATGPTERMAIVALESKLMSKASGANVVIERLEDSTTLESKLEAAIDRVVYGKFDPCVQDGKEVTVSAWYSSNPGLQGYGNTQTEALQHLLQKRKEAASGSTPSGPGTKEPQ
jgi:hypothetical protein